MQEKEEEERVSHKDKQDKKTVGGYSLNLGWVSFEYTSRHAWSKPCLGWGCRLIVGIIGID